jgi:hypothetical protein
MNNMNINDYNGNLDEIKSKLKQKYPVLTKADLLTRKGMEEDLFKMVANKLGITNRELHEVISKL